MKLRTFEVVGMYDMEGMVFARCTTYEKAKKAMRILNKEGFGYRLDIVEVNTSIDTIEIDGKLIEL